jgi:hypothetical protein
VSISVVKCSWMKCSEVLQCSDGPSNKVSNCIRRHTGNRKLLFICILLLADSFIFCRFYFFYQYMVVFLFNTVIYVFLLLGLFTLIVQLP